MINKTLYMKNCFLKKIFLAAALPVLLLFCNAAYAQSDLFGGNQVEQLLNRKRAAEAEKKRAAEAQQSAGCRIVECSRDTLIGAWHSSKNLIISKKQHESGPAQGKFISYKVYWDQRCNCLQ